MLEPDDNHYCDVAEKLAAGRLIPFLGAGANLCDRDATAWAEGTPFLPSGRELAVHLAQRGRYPEDDDFDLLRVSQYVDNAKGQDMLYDYLHEVFDVKIEPTSLHRFLARVAKASAERGKQQLLVVTTNYDDLMEQAFADEGLPYDVVWYEAKQKTADHRRFMHRAPGKPPAPIIQPNEYDGLSIDQLERPAVLKLHGCLDRANVLKDSYVITEDSYIDYLSGTDVAQLIPIALWDRMTRDSFLFLGYSLADWNMRVILNRIWGTRTLVGKSWAIQLEPSDPNESAIEQMLWESRDSMVQLKFCNLATYMEQLQARMPAASPA